MDGWILMDLWWIMEWMEWNDMDHGMAFHEWKGRMEWKDLEGPDKAQLGFAASSI